jgi:hypothetical protein
MFMKKIVEELQAYLVDADADHLDEILDAVEGERRAPRLLPALVTVPGQTVQSMAEIIETEGVLRVKHEDYSVTPETEDGLFVVNHIVRVQTNDQPENSVILMLIAAWDDDGVLFVPVAT